MKSNVKTLYAKKIKDILQLYNVEVTNNNIALELTLSTQESIINHLAHEFGLTLNVNQVEMTGLSLNDIVALVLESLPAPDARPGELRFLMDIKKETNIS